MHSFTDNNGHSWSLVVNIGTIKRVRALCNVNILDVINIGDDGEINSDLLSQLARDPVLLVDVLYAVCKPEADTLNITDEAFGGSLSGDCITTAAEALVEEIIDFFPNPKRQICRKILSGVRSFQGKNQQRLNELCNSNEIEKEIESVLQNLNDSYMKSPESAE